jgi:Mg-chelatase subunit ChlD
LAAAIPLLASLALIAAAGPAPPTAVAAGPARAAGTLNIRCAITPTRTVAPLALLRGDTVRVTTTLQVACADERPLHIVLLVDASEGMMGAPLNGIRSALIDAVDGLDMTRARLGIVSIGGRPETGGAQIVSYLTDDRDRLVARLRGITAIGPPCLTCGLDDALTVVRVGREGRPTEDLREVILLASAGVEPSACAALQGKAREIQAHRILVVTACAGPDCVLRCMAEVATPRFAFRPDSWSGIAGLLRAIQGRSGAFHVLETVRFEDQLAEGFNEAQPAPGEPPRREIVHEVAPWPDGGVTLAYELRAERCGASPVSASAQALLAYEDGRLDILALPNPLVEVACPGVTVTPPTHTPEPTATATAPQASPTPVPQRSPFTAWLPWLGAPGCAAAYPGIDLVLLVDVSGSMAAPIPPFASRWEAARRFAADVVMRLGAADRVGVIAYADLAYTVVGLTPDHDSARQAVMSRLPKADGSRLDEGLRASARLLAEAGENLSRQEVVLLTDGDLNQSRVGDVAAAAAQLRSAEVGLRVVLFDAEAPDDFWRALAGRERVHYLDESRWMGLLAAAHCH